MGAGEASTATYVKHPECMRGARTRFTTEAPRTPSRHSLHLSTPLSWAFLTRPASNIPDASG